jgi:Tfp pilus assembly protein PilF
MKSNNPTAQKKSSKLATHLSQRSSTDCLLPAIIIVIFTCGSFFPVLSNQFVEWDDYDNLVNNSHYRGLGWNQLRWMWTTFHLGPYQPLSWMTLGLDYLIWGMNPVGYHLTNVLFHAANAILFYFICRRLLLMALSVTGNEGSRELSLSAAFAALFFAIHPLRVESVAWATERRDVLSGFFFLWTLYCYLRANSEPHADASSRRWIKLALAAYFLSLLSKAVAITLPIVLVTLDAYPLRRLQRDPRQGFGPSARRVLREKIPFLLMALPFALVALIGQQQATALKSLESYGVVSRLSQALYGASFYLWKTLVPVNLSPLYEIPPDFSPLDPRIVAGGVTTVIITLCLYLLRNRWPAGLVCWIYSLVVVAPVLGIVQTGPQLVADRYSYLTCLSWAVLAGALLLSCLSGSVQKRRFALPGPAATAVAVSVLGIFTSLTWNQTAIWRNTATLWNHVLKLDPNSSIAHYNLARFLARQGSYAEAISHYRQARSIRPDADTHNNLGLLLAIRGDMDASIEEFQQATQMDPNYARAFFNLGRVYARLGEPERAVQNYRRALQLSPNEAEIHLGLGNVLARQGQLEVASEHFEQAVKLKPDFADGHVALARSLAAQGKKQDAEKHYEQALQLLKLQKRALPEG